MRGTWARYSSLRLRRVLRDREGFSNEVLGDLSGALQRSPMSQHSDDSYEFGLFRLDARERRLLREGQAVPLPPKAFDLLLVLVRHHGRLLGKDELLKLVWPDMFVEEANLPSNVSLIRKALGDTTEGRRYIETVPKHGYRFVADVRRVSGDGRASAVEQEPDAQGLAAPSKDRFARQAVLIALALMVGLVALGGAATLFYRWTKNGNPGPPGGQLAEHRGHKLSGRRAISQPVTRRPAGCLRLAPGSQ